MSAIDRWKKIFSHGKHKSVPVRVGEKIEKMTETQACRFDDLTEGELPDSEADSDLQSEESSYKLADEDNPLIEKDE